MKAGEGVRRVLFARVTKDSNKCPNMPRGSPFSNVLKGGRKGDGGDRKVMR